jgi:NADH kinase
VRGDGGGEGAEDHWVGGLNALLKFNYPFGDQDA